eukprot:m.125835 g.125835  ORF g.125835 m.125835 type:complete len:94 (-) comp14501_c1_seq2:1179-1460(-)
MMIASATKTPKTRPMMTPVESPVAAPDVFELNVVKELDALAFSVVDEKVVYSVLLVGVVVVISMLLRVAAIVAVVVVVFVHFRKLTSYNQKTN